MVRKRQIVGAGLALLLLFCVALVCLTRTEALT